MAVTFFFVLGGFVLTLGYKDKVLQPDFSYKQFILRRCIKFYPLHWICLGVALILSVSTMQFGLKDVPILFLNAALVQTLIPIGTVYFSFNAVSWYLADTMFFALVFPYIFKCIIQFNAKDRFLFVFSIVIAYLLVMYYVPTDHYHDILYINPIIRTTDLIYGIMLALCYLKLKEETFVISVIKRYSSFLYCLAFIIIGLLVWESCILDKPSRMVAPVYWPLVGTLLLSVSLADLNTVFGGGYNWLKNKFIQRIGDISFAIFLIHQLVLRCSTILFDSFEISQNIFYVIFTFIVTLIVSYIVDCYVIKSITKWLTKRIQPSMTAR